MIDQCAVYSTVSIGVVIVQDAPVDITVLLSQADQALYYAKARGRNRVEVASLDVLFDRAKLRMAMPAPTAQSAA